MKSLKDLREACPLDPSWNDIFNAARQDIKDAFGAGSRLRMEQVSLMILRAVRDAYKIPPAANVVSKEEWKEFSRTAVQTVIEMRSWAFNGLKGVERYEYRKQLHQIAKEIHENP